MGSPPVVDFLRCRVSFVGHVGTDTSTPVARPVLLTAAQARKSCKALEPHILFFLPAGLCIIILRLQNLSYANSK